MDDGAASARPDELDADAFSLAQPSAAPGAWSAHIGHPQRAIWPIIQPSTAARLSPGTHCPDRRAAHVMPPIGAQGLKPCRCQDIATRWNCPKKNTATIWEASRCWDGPTNKGRFGDYPAAPAPALICLNRASQAKERPLAREGPRKGLERALCAATCPAYVMGEMGLVCGRITCRH